MNLPIEYVENAVQVILGAEIGARRAHRGECGRFAAKIESNFKMKADSFPLKMCVKIDI